MRKIQPESSKDLYGPDMMDAKSQEKKIYYPTTSFDNKTLPEAADWKPGKTYRVTLDLQMTGISQRKGRDGRDRGNYDFNIVGVDTSAGEVKQPAPKKEKRYSRIAKKS